MPRTETDLAERIAERIRREGPIPFDRFVDAALYDEDGGFYARGGGAGRAGRDFVTSPEVGVLFGALVARYLDRAWTELSRPDPFVVVDLLADRQQPGESGAPGGADGDCRRRRQVVGPHDQILGCHNR